MKTLTKSLLYICFDPYLFFQDNYAFAGYVEVSMAAAEIGALHAVVLREVQDRLCMWRVAALISTDLIP